MRTIAALFATATLIWGAPALAAEGTLAFSGKTIAVEEISGGIAYAINGIDGTAGNQLVFEPVNLEVDANGFADLMPLVEGLLNGSNNETNLTLNVDGESHSLVGVRLSRITFPACTDKTAEIPRLQVELSVNMIKPGPGERSAAIPVTSNRHVANNGNIVSCAIAIDGAPAAADAVTSPLVISSWFAPAGVGELRDYESHAADLDVGTVFLRGKTVNAWARKAQIEGQDVKISVHVTYATPSGPTFVVNYPAAKPSVTSLVGDETFLDVETVTITKP